MTFILWFLLTIFILIVCLLFIKISIRFFYKKEGRHHLPKLVIQIGFIPVNIPLHLFMGKKSKEKKADEKPAPEKQVEGFLDRARRVNGTIHEFAKQVPEVFLYIKEHTTIKEFTMYIMMGTGEAGSTGISYGIMWAVLGNIFSLIIHLLYIENPRFDIKADFQKVRFDVQMTCIFSFRLIHIIIAAFMYMQKTDWKLLKKEKS